MPRRGIAVAVIVIVACFIVLALTSDFLVDWVLLGSLVIGSLPGIFFGSHLSARVPDKILRPVLATILVIVGVRMLRA